MSECFEDPSVIENGLNGELQFNSLSVNKLSEIDDQLVDSPTEGDGKFPSKHILTNGNDSTKDLVANNNESADLNTFANCNGTINEQVVIEDTSVLPEGCEETDDFGDFADFTCAPTVEESLTTDEEKSDQIDPSSSNFAEDSADVGWADFASAEIPATEAQFSQPSGSGLTDRQGNDEDIEEFGDFQDDCDSTANHQSSSESLPIFGSTLTDVFTEFNSDSLQIESDLNSLNQLLDDNEGREEELLNQRLWLSLKCIEESLALKCVWNDSKAQRLHFDVLSVNPAMSQLKNANLPAYASQLGSVLTPLKAAEELSEETTGQQTETTTTAEVQSTSGTTFGSSAVQDSLSVPPVEFDWQGSGLKNPLRDGSAVQGALLDLDFLDSATGDSALSKDLERFGLESYDVTALTPPVQSLLAQTISSESNSSRMRKSASEGKTVVNQEVVSILGKLPDLSFMLNPLLMFPVKYAGLEDEVNADQNAAVGDNSRQSFVMAQGQIQVFSQQKPVVSVWGTSDLGLNSPRQNYMPIGAEDQPPVNDQPLSLRISPATSGHSSVSTPDHQPWASFEDSDVEGERGERSPGTEHMNLLEHSVDEDQNSVDNASLASDDDPFSINDTLRQYYTDCFTRLQEKIYKLKDIKGAIPGSHRETMAFFEKSNIPRDELSHIWNLSDINQDGFLNLGEFCTAMHLSVLRVKSNIAVPENLPPHLIPRYTPPRNAPAEVLHSDSESSGSFYPPSFGDATDGVAKSTVAKTQPKRSAVEQPSSSHAPKISGPSKSYDAKYTSGDDSATASPQLKQFTNTIPISRDQDLVHPVPVKMSPENTLEEGHLTAYGKGRTFSEPPQPHDDLFSGKVVRPRTQTAEGFPPVAHLPPKTTVKPAVVPVGNSSVAAGHKSPSRYHTNVPSGSVMAKPPLLSPKDQPPPPPPPRPIHKHYRSSSLDLNPKDLGPTKIPGPMAPPPAPPPRISPHGPFGDSAMTQHSVKLPVVQNHQSIAPEVTPRSRAVDSGTQTEFGDLTDVGLDRKRRSSAPMLELTVDTLLPEDVNGGGNELDWKERCARLARVNEELEKQMAELTEKRVIVERELRELLAK